MKKKQSGVVFCSVLLPGRIRRNLQTDLFRVLLRDEIAKRTASAENITFRCAIYFHRNINCWPLSRATAAFSNLLKSIPN